MGDAVLDIGSMKVGPFDCLLCPVPGKLFLLHKDYGRRSFLSMKCTPLLVIHSPRYRDGECSLFLHSRR